MYFELKENKPHGTKDDPFSTYHIKNEGRSYGFTLEKPDWGNSR